MNARHMRSEELTFSNTLPNRPAAERRHGLFLLRVLIAANLLAGLYYLQWRYTASINWQHWPFALAVLAAESYSYLDAWLFGLTIWRLQRQDRPAPPVPGTTVDVFITCFNEPVELVRKTARAARAISWPHSTYILDDGNSAEIAAMAEQEGVGYLVRSAAWDGKARHAKAGNINNALFQTSGELILILDADQIAAPDILHRTLGYFSDPRVAFVQTPQWFYNVTRDDPLGAQAPLFYGPIQQGKHGWNAAFFCGSNAVLRREALMQMGISQYVRELEQRIRRRLRLAEQLLRHAKRRLPAADATHIGEALDELRSAVWRARAALRAKASIQELTWQFQRSAEAVSRRLVSDDLERIKAELAALSGNAAADRERVFLTRLDDPSVLDALARRDVSPLAAVPAVRELLLSLDLDRADEAQPLMPVARISVTEDMATSMRLHAAGWRSVYHHEVLARGLAPEDLRSSFQQRLRWAQGTLQIMLRENPLVVRGLSWGQKLMYLSTMWGYLSGLASLVYLAAPVLFLLFGILPIQSGSGEFFSHLLPYLALNQLCFFAVGRGRSLWRGQQYNLALFPLWIKALLGAIGNVYFGRELAFVVTPKTRQHETSLRLIAPQLSAIAALNIALVWGLARLALGLEAQATPTLLNALWAAYNIVALSVVLLAVGPLQRRARSRQEAGT